jgi:hypothetical protein
MSQSLSVLTVNAADKVAEIEVLDGSKNQVAVGLGTVRAELPAGIYRVRVRVGPTKSEQLVSLDQDRAIDFGQEALEFPTPVPLAMTSKTHEYHMLAAHEVSQSTPVALGEGAKILVFSRDWSREQNATSAPMAGLSLHDAIGKKLVNLSQTAEVRRERDSSAGSFLSVAPGAYRLRLTLPDNTASERIIIAVRDWQTQIFLLMRNYGRARRADLGGAAIVMSRSGFDAQGQSKGARVAALARFALTNGHKIADAVYQELLELKFEDPILGLLTAHLLLRETPVKGNLFEEVLANMNAKLGQDHPDVQALGLRSNERGDQSNIRFRLPPMLRSSWDLITTATVGSAVRVQQRSVASSILGLVLPTAPWLTWRASDSKPAILREARRQKQVALETFVRAYAKTSRSERSQPASRAQEASPSRVVLEQSTDESPRDPPSEGPPPGEPVEDSIGGTQQQAVNWAQASISNDTRAELSRNFGVTDVVLASMLSKLKI